MLFVNELEREAIFQVADDAGEDLAERDPGLHRWSLSRPRWRLLTATSR